MEKLYGDTISLYRLDQIDSPNGQMAAGKEDLGKLPGTSVVLLSALAAWVLIALYVVFQIVKKKRNHS